ncbi:MAG: hypothetical protein QM774_02825 [Gordonia sp. (in: high G+C Gram-positive bacteria)]
MLNALAYAFVDAINVLVIGVLVGMAIMLGTGKYAKSAFLMLIGDWLGVLGLALVVLLVFDGLGDWVKGFVESWIFAVMLIITGVVTAILTFRGSGEDNALSDWILEKLNSPGLVTVAVGAVLGLAQSATSLPFYAGLAVLSTSNIPTAERYLGLFLYASVAVSLTVLSALLLGLVRRKPDSAVGRLFATARRHPGEATKLAGYLVAVLLIGIGVLHLF